MSSFSLSKGTNFNKFNDTILKFFHYNSDVLIEQWLYRAAYTVAFLSKNILPSICIIFSRLLYDNKSKYLSNKNIIHMPKLFE
ncbi:hypothetical protein [Candidatus Profftia lariciata]|uniref:hypothetical protein n=1 Tax=Candidatus Profftia lariciata TaxID=1987921 RepID=UPI001D034238